MALNSRDGTLNTLHGAGWKGHKQGNEPSELCLSSIRYLDVWGTEHLGIGRDSNTSKPNGDATLSGVYLKVSSSYMTSHTAAD